MILMFQDNRLSKSMHFRDILIRQTQSLLWLALASMNKSFGHHYQDLIPPFSPGRKKEKCQENNTSDRKQ